jgi:hypothetical protein
VCIGHVQHAVQRVLLFVCRAAVSPVWRGLLSGLGKFTSFDSVAGCYWLNMVSCVPWPSAILLRLRDCVSVSVASADSTTLSCASCLDWGQAIVIVACNVMQGLCRECLFRAGVESFSRLFRTACRMMGSTCGSTLAPCFLPFLCTDVLTAGCVFDGRPPTGVLPKALL